MSSAFDVDTQGSVASLVEVSATKHLVKSHVVCRHLPKEDGGAT